jgi:hypothetical protein
LGNTETTRDFSETLGTGFLVFPEQNPYNESVIGTVKNSIIGAVFAK